MRIMKKITKTILKIIGIIICIVVTGFLGIILLSFIDKDNSNEEAPQVNIEYQGQIQTTKMQEEDIPDSDYYPTVAEAVQNADIDVEEGEEYQRNIDNVIAKFENDDYLSIYFQSFKGDDEICDTFVKLIKKLVNDETLYAVLRETTEVSKINSWYMGTALEALHGQLTLSDYSRIYGIDSEHCRFIWGSLRKDEMEEDESIDKLQVEGKKPDGIIEYQEFGDTWYFW